MPHEAQDHLMMLDQVVAQSEADRQRLSDALGPPAECFGTPEYWADNLDVHEVQALAGSVRALCADTTDPGYPVVIITWVHYLGPPGPSTS